MLYFMKRFIEEAPERLRKKDLIKVRNPSSLEFDLEFIFSRFPAFILSGFLRQFGRKWFQPEEASAFRTEVKELVIREFEGYMLNYGIQESHASSGASENGEEQLYQK